MKTCSKCRLSKSLEMDFYKDTRASDGLKSECKSCFRLDCVKREKTPKYREARRVSSKRYRSENHDKFIQTLRKSYQKHIDQRRAEGRNYYYSHKEQQLASARKWKDNHPEQTRERLRKWRLVNREKVRNYSSLRRARRHSARVENVLRRIVFQRDKGLCQIRISSKCHGQLDVNTWQLDHITALSRGGEHSYANTQAACPPCNRQKWAN